MCACVSVCKLLKCIAKVVLRLLFNFVVFQVRQGFNVFGLPCGFAEKIVA